MKIGKYTLVGFCLDFFDWIGLGMIPILADIIDVAAALFWYKITGALGLVTLVELVPLADFLPTNIAIGLYADSHTDKEAKK